MLSDVNGWLIAAALLILANTLGGVIGTGLVVVFLVRRQDTAIHALEAEHDRELEAVNREHQSETSALRARIIMLESGHATLIRLLQSRSLISDEDATSISLNGASDKVLNALKSLFTLSELEVIAAEVGMNIEHVGGDTLPVVALRVVKQARHEQKYDELMAVVRRERPNAF